MTVAFNIIHHAITCTCPRPGNPKTLTFGLQTLQENRPNKMAKEMHSKQHKFRGFQEISQSFIYTYSHSKGQMAVWNVKLHPRLNPGLLHFPSVMLRILQTQVIYWTSSKIFIFRFLFYCRVVCRGVHSGGPQTGSVIWGYTPHPQLMANCQNGCERQNSCFMFHKNVKTNGNHSSLQNTFNSVLCHQK